MNVKLLLRSLIFCLLFSYKSIQAQSGNKDIIMTYVDTVNDVITVKNISSTVTYDISTYEFTSMFTWKILNTMTIENGSLNLTPNAEVTLSSPGFLDDVGSDLVLFDGSAADVNDYKDYLQWGSTGHTRANIATAGAFWINGPISFSGPYERNQPYQYAMAGAGYWSQGTVLTMGNYEKGAFKILKNPSSDQLSMKLPNDNKSFLIEIFDVSGRVIYKQKRTGYTQTIDVEKWKNGVYLVRATLDKYVVVTRFIKQ